MNRYYFVTNDMNDLVHVEQELEQQGVLKEQMRVLPFDDAVAREAGLESVDSLFRKDIVGSLAIGFGIGCALAALFLLGALLFGIAGTQAWLLVGLIALFIIGVCTWEGGLLGVHLPNRKFRRFGRDLKRGFSVFFVDIKEGQEQALLNTAREHKQLRPVGNGGGESDLMVKLRHNWNQYSQTI